MPACDGHQGIELEMAMEIEVCVCVCEGITRSSCCKSLPSHHHIKKSGLPRDPLCHLCTHPLLTCSSFNRIIVPTDVNGLYPMIPSLADLCSTNPRLADRKSPLQLGHIHPSCSPLVLSNGSNLALSLSAFKLLVCQRHRQRLLN